MLEPAIAIIAIVMLYMTKGIIKSFLTQKEKNIQKDFLDEDRKNVRDIQKINIKVDEMIEEYGQIYTMSQVRAKLNGKTVNAPIVNTQTPQSTAPINQ